PLLIPPNFTLISRAPAVVSVESATVIRARSTGSTWLVGSIAVEGIPVSDSAEVVVGCTLELQMKVSPASQTLRAGESFTPSGEVLSCQGQVQVADTIRWVADDSTVMRVDSTSGRTTGMKVGESAVTAHDVRFRGLSSSIPVTVVNPP